MKRIERDDMMMGLIKLLEMRSTCIRRHTAAILVRDGIILSTGYNGPPSRLSHCEKCMRKELKIPSGKRLEICRAVHAEQNAILQCAIKHTDPRGSTLYCDASPCVTCAKLLIQIQIKKIICFEIYPDKLAKELLDEAGIEIEVYNGVIQVGGIE